MPLTSKQEKFAQEVASGKTQADAYREAYDAQNMKDATIWKRASELMSDGELAWTTEDKPLRSKTINRAHLNGSVHPTQKPVQIIEFSVDYLKVPQKGAVLDLFAGSGTLAIVCEKTDRRSFLMERDPGYVDVIVRRWQEFTGKQATHEATGATFAEVEADSALAVAEDV